MRVHLERHVNAAPIAEVLAKNQQLSIIGNKELPTIPRHSERSTRCAPSHVMVEELLSHRHRERTSTKGLLTTVIRCDLGGGDPTRQPNAPFFVFAKLAEPSL